MSLVERKLLLSRVLTRSGDQAWEFALPLGLIHLAPERIDIAALYYLAVKIGQTFALPLAGKWMDQNSRAMVIRAGIWSQFFGVLFGACTFFFLDSMSHVELNLGAGSWIVMFGALCVFGLLASLGSTLTEISVGNDLAPQLIEPDRLTDFNASLRRIDLLTETLSPVLAGLLLMFQSPWVPYAGFFVIALWNLISFFPEYFLLRQVLIANADKVNKVRIESKFQWPHLSDFQIFFRHPVFLPVLSYSMLWLTVISPHGVLLTGFLKGQWSLSETTIGVFRGSGAIFGLISTVTFPFLATRLGYIRSGLLHVGFQVICLLLALIFFFQSGFSNQILFLLFVLFSRIGLYGFGNAELEIRQRLIQPAERGLMNSMSLLLTTFATIFIFLAGWYLKTFSQFYVLILLSVLFVALGFLTYGAWVKKIENKTEH